MIKKQILEFALKNWKAILIVLLFAVIAMKNQRDYALMQKAYETQADSHKAQIDGLKEIHKQEIREKQGEYRNKFNQDREQLIIDIENRFGIQYAP